MSLINKILRDKELWIIGIIIFGFAGLNLPFAITRGLRLFSYGMVLLIFLRRRNHITYLISQDKILLTLHILAIFSVLWTVDPYITLTRFLALARTTLVGIILATYPLKDQAMLFTKILIIAIFLSLLAVIALPSYGIREGSGYWQGIFVFKFSLGLFMAYGFSLTFSKFLFATQSFKDKVASALISLAALILIIFSESVTSLVMVLVSMLLIPFYVAAKQGKKIKASVFVFLILGILVGTLLIFSNLDFIVEDLLGKDLTFTGRQSLWTEIIDQVMKRPLLGYGFHAFWHSDESLIAVSKNGWPRLPPPGEYLVDFHSHSGYVEIFSQLGFLGLFLMGLSYTIVLARIFRYLSTNPSIESLWMLQIVMMMIASNYSDVPSFMAANNLQWILYASISTTTMLYFRRLNKERKKSSNGYTFATSK